MPKRQSSKKTGRRKKSDLGFFSPLMRRILAVNIIPVAILGSGILYLNQFWNDLLEQRTEDLLIHAEIIAGALGESTSLGPESQTILPEPARQIIGRLVVSMIEPSGFAIRPRIPASWRICAAEPRAPESAIM